MNVKLLNVCTQYRVGEFFKSHPYSDRTFNTVSLWKQRIGFNGVTF